jgi:proteasome lid subunit RPN8/RPN11
MVDETKEDKNEEKTEESKEETIDEKKDAYVHDVYIQKHILDEIENRCKNNTYEIIGMLVGNAYKSKGKEYVMITGFLFSESIEKSPIFTQVIDGAVGEMSIKRDKDYPGSIITGWWHSHPNLGVFLSSVDIKTMEMFNKGFHVALVVDPIRGERAFFKIDDEKHYHYVSYAVLREKK